MGNFAIAVSGGLVVAILLWAAWRPGAAPLPGYLDGLILRLIVATALIGLPGAAIVGAIVTLSGLEGGTLSTTVAGAVIATGWLVAFSLREYQSLRDRDQARRDTLIALRAEIFAAVEKLDNHDIAAEAALQQRLIGEHAGKDPPYHPFSAAESPPDVFRALGERIALIEEATLEPIIRFYAAYLDLATFTIDFREERMAQLGGDRRIAAHRALTRLRQTTLYRGLRAVDAINRDLNVAGEIYRTGKNPEITAATIPQ